MSEAVAIDEIVFDAHGFPIDWIIQDINPAYEQIYQRSREHVIGRRATEVYPVWLERRAEFENYARIIESGEPLLLEMDDPTTGRHVLISRTMGNHRFAAATTDITERKRAEEERERLLEEVSRHVAELDAIITALPDPLIIYDAVGTILRVNPAVKKVLHYDPTGEARGYVALCDAAHSRWTITAGGTSLGACTAREGHPG